MSLFSDFWRVRPPRHYPPHTHIHNHRPPSARLAAAPELAEAGALHPSRVYTPADLRAVVAAAPPTAGSSRPRPF